MQTLWQEYIIENTITHPSKGDAQAASSAVVKQAKKSNGKISERRNI